MTLEIVCPKKVLYRGDVSSVSFPGALGAFTVLDNHAPLISTLTAGEINFQDKKGITHISIKKGIVELNNNQVTVCVELANDEQNS